MANSLKKYLQESTKLRTLELSWAASAHTYDCSVPVSVPTIASICDGIAASVSLRSVGVDEPPTDDDADMVANKLAHAIEQSASVKKFLTRWQHKSFFDVVADALADTQASRNFEMSFHKIQTKTTFQLKVNRNPPCERLLPERIPLALWPHVLDAADCWEEETSHNYLDALYFLIKERMTC